MDGGDAAGRAVAEALSRNVRGLRAARGWSLDTLAARSGVSKGLLVQIERGTSNPSIGTLIRLCEALDVTAAQLVDLGDRPAVRVVRRPERVTLWHDDGGSAGELLVGMDRREHVELWEWRLAPGGERRAERHSTGTRELLHVLAGTLRLTVGGAVHELGAGDAVLFAADVSHAYANAGDVETRFGMVVVMPSSPAE